MSWLFFVPGIPTPQGNLKPYTFKRKDGKVRAAMTEGTKGIKSWRMDVAVKAIQESRNGLNKVNDKDAAVNMQIEFIMPRPASVTKRRRHPCVKPDLSKLVRAIEDALTGILYRDDAQICSLLVSKRYQTASDPAPGATISVQRKT